MTDGAVTPFPDFRPYEANDRSACLALFDANCPEFFDRGERSGYVQFLDTIREGYEVCQLDGRIVGAYGIRPHAKDELVIRWILIAPDAQGRGVGRAMMTRVLNTVRQTGVRRLHMAASHKSAPFFARFGARATATVQHGWGPNLHRIDMVLVP
jgi:GNAT superfamily N-acetyltransferase